MPSVLVTLQATGVFSRKGLLEIINKFVDLDVISCDKRVSFATCISLADYSPKYFMLNGCTDEKIKSILCATSAIPVIFPPEEIDGESYIDGGIQKIGDNLPIRALYEHGCDTVIVVNLVKNMTIDRTEFPNLDIHEICPKDNLGNLITGILDFSVSGAKRRIESGYIDAKKILSPIFDQILLE